MVIKLPLVPTLPPPCRERATEAASVRDPVRSPARLSVIVGLVMSPLRTSDVPVRVTEVPVVRLPEPMVSPSFNELAVLFEVTFKFAKPAAEPPLMVKPPSCRLVTVTSTPPVVARLRYGVAVLSPPTVLLPARVSCVPAVTKPVTAAVLFANTKLPVPVSVRFSNEVHDTVPFVPALEPVAV